MLALVVVTAITALHQILNSAMVRTRLRDRVEAALAARLGSVELGSHSDVDWSLRLSFGPVRISPEPGSPVVMEMERVRVRPRWTALLAGRLEPGLVQLRTVVLRPGTHLEGLKALRPTGRMILYGAASGQPDPVMQVAPPPVMVPLPLRWWMPRAGAMSPAPSPRPMRTSNHARIARRSRCSSLISRES